MAISNYTDLKSAVSSFLHRTDLDSVIPVFVSMAESDFNRSLRLTGQLTTTTLTASSQTTALPSDWLATKSVNVYAGGAWRMVDPNAEEILASYQTSGYPRHYSISGTNLVWGPSPDGTYSVRLTYWKKIPDLATYTTNFLLTDYPDLYLWRTILEGAKYTRDQDLILLAGTEYQRVMSEVQSKDEDRQYGSASMMRTEPWR